MSGVKGRSGRKSLRDEERRLRTIEKAWAVIERQLSDPKIPHHEKVDIACRVVTRDMPNQLEHSGKVDTGYNRIVIINNGHKDNTQTFPSRISGIVSNVPGDDSGSGNG
jgi:hypothetical protein